MPSVVGIPEIKLNDNLIKDSRRPSAMTVEAPPSRKTQQHIIDFCPVPLPVQDQPKVSLLSQLIKSNQTAMDNPFAEEYAVFVSINCSIVYSYFNINFRQERVSYELSNLKFYCLLAMTLQSLWMYW